MGARIDQIITALEAANPAYETRVFRDDQVVPERVKA